MKRRRVLAMLMTAVMTFTSVAPETAMVATAGDDDTAVDVVVEELPFDLKGMPADYVLDETQIEMKADLKENSALDAFKGMTEGKDYEADTVVCLADSAEEAQTIAEAYNGELELYAQGVAEIRLNGSVTVEQAFTVGADEKYAMPVVEPNYLGKLDDPFKYNTDGDYVAGSDFIAGMETSAKKPGKLIWQDWVLGNNGAAALLSNPDEFIKDPASVTYQWMHDMVGTYNAWSASMGSPDITVAVIDTGVYPDHPDFDGRVTQIAVGDVPADVYSSSHATHVAGIIGASANNGIGVAGIAPEVKILSLNVFGDSDEYTSAAVARALEICADQKVQVANMSIGFIGYSAMEAEQMKKAIDAGCCVFAAMGNENSESRCTPAVYDGVIAVASVNIMGERSVFSNFGSWADIAAPGTTIMSCYNPEVEDDLDRSYEGKGYYGLMSGTSMASPVAAGCAALYMSKFGVVTPDKMLQIMQKTGTKSKSKKIGKIVNVGEMFLSNGAGGKAAATRSDDGKSFTIELEGAAEGSYAVYTVDGTEPAMMAGAVVNGTVYTGSVELVPAKGQKTVVVKTLAVDPNGIAGDVESYSFEVPEAGIEGAKAGASFTISGDRVVNGKADLFTVNIPGTEYDDTVLELNAGTSVKWSSSNAKVLQVVTAEGEVTTVKALKSGSAKITAKAADGSKAVLNVKVVVPVSKLVVDVDGFGYGGMIAVGKSRKVNVYIGDNYGKPSNKKLKWDYIVGDEAATAIFKEKKAVKISSSGKVSISRKNWNKALEAAYGAKEMQIGDRLAVTVIAQTTDGTELFDHVPLVVHNCATIFEPIAISGDAFYGCKTFEYDAESWLNDADSIGIQGDVMLLAVDSENRHDLDVDVSSSNADLVSVRADGILADDDGNTITDIYKGKSVCFYMVTIYAPDTAKPGKKGSAKITVKLKDGSNKKATFTVKIK